MTQRPPKPKHFEWTLGVFGCAWLSCMVLVGLIGGGWSFLVFLAGSFIAFAIGVVIEKYEVGK